MARYPEEFSHDAQNRIDGAKLEAYRKLQRDRKRPLPEGFMPKYANSDRCAVWDRRALIEYVFTVVFAFAAEARNCVRQDVWTIGRANEEITYFAGAFAYETDRGEEHYDRLGRPISSLTTFNAGSPLLLPDIKRKLTETPKWQAHLDELIANADERPAKKTKPRQSTSPKSRRVNGQRLKKIRMDLAWTQDKMAEVTQQDLAAIQRGEAGKKWLLSRFDEVAKRLTAAGVKTATGADIKAKDLMAK